MSPSQDNFAKALRDSRLPVPQGLVSWNALQPLRRFGVYRNNVLSGLAGALQSRFPAAERITGPDFFLAMAYEFVVLHPPRSPLLLSYGDNFADFVETFEPARQLPYLADVIRLEAVRGRAYHAADAAPVNPKLLRSVREEQLSDIVFSPHPSLSVLRSRHPVVTIWAMNSGEMPVAGIEDWQGEDALVVRPQMVVEVHRLPPGGAVFLDALARGIPLSGAVRDAMSAAPDFDLSANLAGALQAGAFTSLSVGAGNG